MHWQFGVMEFGKMKGNTSNWSNFCMLLRRAGLTASAVWAFLFELFAKNDLFSTAIFSKK